MELLPYMTRIFSARKADTSTLEKITKFKPTSYLSTAEDGLEEDDGNAATTSTGAFSGFGRGRSAVSKNEAPAADMEKMYIEEDDIEDD